MIVLLQQHFIEKLGIMYFIILLLLNFFILKSHSQKAVSKSTGPPAFFLQDPQDGLCLAGSVYKRCSVDTLWFVTGKPGAYQIHHRLVDESDEESCMARSNCHEEDSDINLMNCNHCGAKKWNILGDSQTGCVYLYFFLYLLQRLNVTNF